MLRQVNIEEWINDQTTPILDVRSPSEYNHGHIPGSISLSLFDDEQRALIGTTYKQIGKQQAMMQALEIVGPIISELVRKAQSAAPVGKVRIHCWRGGMRSGSLAWLLSTIGFDEVYTLKRGYKAYRQWVLCQLSLPYPLLILGGKTGSAKTEILEILSQQNQAVVDLEYLAHHKGSAFGWIGEQDQPSQEQFENNLTAALYLLKNQDPVWVEDESERIGLLRIPHPFFEKMRSAVVCYLDIPKAIRIPYLVNHYAHFGDDKLEQSILRISKRLGGLNTKLALEALHRQDYEQVTDLVLFYYDKSYETGVKCRNPSTVIRIASDTIDPHINADLILRHKPLSKHGNHQTHAV